MSRRSATRGRRNSSDFATPAAIWKAQPGPAALSFVLSVSGFFGCLAYIPEVKDLFISAGCSGKDLNKTNQPVMYGVCVFGAKLHSAHVGARL